MVVLALLAPMRNPPHSALGYLYLALGNIALVFAALTSRDSEIGRISIARDLLSYSLSTRLILFGHSIYPLA